MKPITVLLVALLVATNSAWLYRAFDDGITDSYRRQERYEMANRLIAASTLAAESVRGRPKTEVEILLRKLFPNDPSFEKEGSLQTIWISMPLNADGSVAGVTIDQGTRREAAPATTAAVGNEIFYPSASSGGSPR